MDGAGDGKAGVTVVVPVFREAENLRVLAEGLAEVLGRSEMAWDLLLVDDDSRDGSEEVVERLAAEGLPVRLRVRRGVGRDLSLAVLEGLRLAARDRVVVMDADLSHPPACVVDLLAVLDEGWDMAVASRYVDGGRVERGWSGWRFAASCLATWLVRPLTDCRDPMSGFFAVDRHRLGALERFRPVGYKIGLELMVRGGLRVAEVPFRFRTRRAGVSKMGVRQQVAFLRHVGRLYTFCLGGRRLAGLAAVSLGSLAVDLGCYGVLQSLGMEHRLARLVSWWPALVSNWALDRRLTLAARVREAGGLWTWLLIGGAGRFVVSGGSYAALTSMMAFFDRWRVAALLVSVALGGLVTFMSVSLSVYRRHVRDE